MGYLNEKNYGLYVCHSIQPPSQKAGERVLEYKVHTGKTVPNY